MEDSDVSQNTLTWAEYNVLASVSLVDGMYNRTRLLRHVLFMESARQTPQLSITMAEAGLSTCLLEGWVKVLMQEDCRRDKERWAEDVIQAVSENEYQEGCIDFTVEGAQLWNRIRSEEAEAGGKRVAWGIRYAWRFAGQVSVFSAYEDELKTCVEAILSGKNDLHTEPYRITRMEGPFALGEWWVDRFTRLPQGYRMDVYLTLDAKE